MQISIGADERNPVVDFVLHYLQKKDHSVIWHGPEKQEIIPWPVVARQVAEDVAGGLSQEGILFCWTGTGVSIAANKVPGIRAALCGDAQSARGARLWNNANILCLSIRLVSEPIAGEILDAWFGTGYIPNPEDDSNLELLKQIEENFHPKN